MTTPDDSLARARVEAVRLHPADPAWPALFIAERERLMRLIPSLQFIEHIGSTAVPGLAAKPIIDLMATVPSMLAADAVVKRLCTPDGDYTTSAEFNASLGDRRWLMRHAAGRRTHHLHLVLPDSRSWSDALAFRNRLRADPAARAEYLALKEGLAATCYDDREAYTAGKSNFIEMLVNSDRPSALPSD